MNILGAEAECVSRMAVEWLSGRKGKPFGKLPVAVQRGCIQSQLMRRRIPADYELVERLRSHPGSRVTVSPETTVLLDDHGRLRLLESNPPSNYAFRPSKGNKSLEAELRRENGRRSITFGGLKIHWRFDSQGTRIPSKPRAGREFFDADKVGLKVILRHWEPGDRFQPIGLSSPVKLQDLFTNQKIPREQRHKLVVVTTAEGELVWVEKLRISERFKLSEHTNRRLQWRWKQL